MQIESTNLMNAVIIKPRIFSDSRGFFLETFQRERYKELGINVNFVQDNLSSSSQGVLRGLHFQTQNPQDKLVSVISGEVFDVAVDLRKHSPTYKKWFGCILSDKNRHQFFVPKGFAHGFYVLSPTAVFSYKCSDYYYPQYESGIIWNDPEINIQWPMNKEPILSNKDRLFLTLSKTEIPSFSDC